MKADVSDVVVIGAGPAGVTAAIFLAKKKHRVTIIDSATFPRKSASSAWLNARAVPLLDGLGVKAKPLLKHPFSDVTFYRADFSQSTKPAFTDPPGYLMDRVQFDNILVDAAARQSVNVVQGCAATNVDLRENSVVVELADGRQVAGRLLVLASGRNSALLKPIGLSANTLAEPMWTAQVDAVLPKKATSREPHVGVVLGLHDPGSFGLCCLSPDRASVAVNWIGERDGAISALINLCRGAFEHEVVPVDLSDQARAGELLASPAGAALDTESHVGKHALVIGDAGGFVAAATNEGIYLGMWSAQIAVEVIDKALHGIHSQDELIAFDSNWRMQIADYLRSPHTDIQFLLPLIFSNQAMADRMGAAFFSGENI